MKLPLECNCKFNTILNIRHTPVICTECYKAVEFMKKAMKALRKNLVLGGTYVDYFKRDLQKKYKNRILRIWKPAVSKYKKGVYLRLSERYDGGIDLIAVDKVGKKIQHGTILTITKGGTIERNLNMYFSPEHPEFVKFFKKIL